jgi:hypothetical protein
MSSIAATKTLAMLGCSRVSWLRSAEDAVAVQPVEAVLNHRFSVSEAWKREALGLVRLSR